MEEDGKGREGRGWDGDKGGREGSGARGGD